MVRSGTTIIAPFPQQMSKKKDNVVVRSETTENGGKVIYCKEV